MGDMGDVFNAMRADTKSHRARMLEQADTEGWERLTDHHFRRWFNGDCMEWWPSGGKAKYQGLMVYGHRKVARLIARLKASPPGLTDEGS